MKIKEIKAGVAYAKREKNKYSTAWGVPVTTEFLYEYLSYNRSKGTIYPGKSVLVLTNNAYGSGVSATVEDAIAKVPSVQVSKTIEIDDLNKNLHKHGLSLEIWLPRDIEGDYEEVKNGRDAERKHDQDMRKSTSSEAAELRAQFERLKTDLNVPHAYATIDTTDVNVTMSFSSWKALMDRVEALVESDPLNSGKL